METLKFEQLPNAVANLTNEVRELKAFIINNPYTQHEIEIPVQLDGAMLITGLTKPTLYGKVQRNEIPYHKKANRLYFFKSEIIAWIRTGKQKTKEELENDVDSFLSKKNKRLLK